MLCDMMWRVENVLILSYDFIFPYAEYDILKIIGILSDVYNDRYNTKKLCMNIT